MLKYKYVFIPSCISSLINKFINSCIFFCCRRSWIFSADIRARLERGEVVLLGESHVDEDHINYFKKLLEYLKNNKTNYILALEIPYTYSQKEAQNIVKIKERLLAVCTCAQKDQKCIFVDIPNKKNLRDRDEEMARRIAESNKISGVLYFVGSTHLVSHSLFKNPGVGPLLEKKYKIDPFIIQLQGAHSPPPNPGIDIIQFTRENNLKNNSKIPTINPSKKTFLPNANNGKFPVSDGVMNGMRGFSDAYGSFSPFKPIKLKKQYSKLSKGRVAYTQ